MWVVVVVVGGGGRYRAVDVLRLRREYASYRLDNSEPRTVIHNRRRQAPPVDDDKTHQYVTFLRRADTDY